MRKKLLILIVILCVAFSNFANFAYATDNYISISIRIEGISETIVPTSMRTVESGSTAWDAVEHLLDTEEILYVASPGAYGVYISSINGEAAGTFGPDGWLYMVNNIEADVGMDSYVLEDGDSVVVYYGGYDPQTLIPDITISPRNPEPGQSFTVHLQATYKEWEPDFSDFEMVTVDIAEAKITFNGVDYTTENDGTVILQAPVAGDYTISYSKARADNYPLIVRGETTVSIGRLRVATPVFSDSLTTLSKIQSGAINCSVEVKNSTTGELSAQLVAAVYQDENLVSVAVSPLSEASIAVGEEKPLNVEVTIPSGSGYYIKTFVLEDFNNLMPFGKSTILDEEGIK